MRLRVMLAVVLAAIVLTATPATASAADIASPVTCTLPDSNADSLELSICTTRATGGITRT